MKNYLIIATFLLLGAFESAAQDWNLELSSTVELRTLRLSNIAEEYDKSLGGATIALYQGTTIVKQVYSDATGDFKIDVPPNGEYILVVSYQDCNPKKFLISTKGVPENLGKENFKPRFSIGGAIMAKPLNSIDYSILSQPLAKVVYMKNGKKFDHEDGYTDQMLTSLGNLKKSEDDLIERFIAATRAGDAALKKSDCPLAKASYEKALALIPGEQYPKDQLVKAGQCLKEKDDVGKKTAEEATAKAAAEKAASEKALAGKAAKEKELADKATADAAAKTKADAEAKAKADADKAASEKALAEKTAKDKANAEAAAKAKADAESKADADKLAKQKADAEKAAADAAAKEKELADKTAKEKAGAEAAAKAKADAESKAEADKLAKQKADAEKNAADAAARSKAEAEKAEKDKATADAAAKAKTEADVAAKAKAEADKEAAARLAKQKAAQKADADAAAKNKAEADKAAKEKALADKAAKEKANAEAAAKAKANAAKEKEEAGKLAKEKAAQLKTEPQKTVENSPAEKEPVIVPKETETTAKETPGSSSGDSKYKIPQVLGGNKYKDAVTKADGYYKMKRYTEAKTAYEEALQVKPDDAHATNRLAEINKVLNK